MTLRGLALATLATIVLCAQARPGAADPVQLTLSWAGFYIGGNIGYGWGNARSNIGFSGPTSVVPPFAYPGFAASDSAKLSGVIGGGQIGYNWQTASGWVFGLEADLQDAGENGSKSRADSFSFAAPFPLVLINETTTTNWEAKISWFGTARGRVGYAWGRTMLYATGGLAYGGVKLAGTTTISGTAGGGAPIAPIVTPFNASKVNVGWSLGGGIESALAGSNNWTWKIEYLHVDLGALDVSAATPSMPTLTGGSVTMHARFTDDIVRAGISYRFGSP